MVLFLEVTGSINTAAVLAGPGIPAFLYSRDTPTPVIAFELLWRQVDGVINFTASHNPAEYNGIKFFPLGVGLCCRKRPRIYGVLDCLLVVEMVPVEGKLL